MFFPCFVSVLYLSKHLQVGGLFYDKLPCGVSECVNVVFGAV